MGGLILTSLARRLKAGVNALRRRAPADPDDDAFKKFVADNFDRTDYLARHPDVARSGLDPMRHWLDFGIFEGRAMSRAFQVRTGSAVSRGKAGGWQTFTHRRVAVAVKASGLPDRVLAQIAEQSRLDAAILAPGANAIQALPEVDFSDMVARKGLDLADLLTEIPERPRAVLLMPFLGVGGSEKFAANLVEAFQTAGLSPALVLVTDQSSAAAGNWRSLSILAPLRNAQVVFWRDHCQSGGGDASLLVRVIQGLAPQIVVVINSRIGLDMVARHGRGLSQCSNLFCMFFGLSPRALGAPYGWRFPRTTLPFATAVTDNGHTARILQGLFHRLPRQNIAVLPAMAEPAGTDIWEERLVARVRHASRTSTKRRWVWISRIEPFKGLAILNQLAKLRGHDEFDLFGPPSADLPALGLIQPNICYRGVLDDVSAADFSEYDGFVFTSLFEGMPNIVLEMAQHAIPMALARVGGLDETFDSDSVLFVEPDTPSAAEAFAAALDKISLLPPDRIERMVTTAYQQTYDRHAPEAFRHNAARLFTRS
jgi:glycosyltransferase involved in cell wall biosynthesis